VSYNAKGGVTAVGLKAHNEIKETLVRIGFPLLAHVIRRRFVKVQSTHSDLGHLILLQLQTKRELMFTISSLVN
jgi:hypothetical protein